ncbi:Murein DD-endopeptidase MepM and murein hydrolase activator NlpD, contain LysM domain [Zhouia amylolytica]|uniref:Murein DD-endopeptidase MepM and murein hydrolase activator NlpD, contain LysM domain n=1 Tax=Zhouia amylolytica TaxID=376730 RepID=A0A1I6PS82_9FLAO|nr:M23 family metallopeptidase [Zhouia amylolytica]MCQ0112830.1 M23 family metallopeptidase [Zhouia amylolytica]SFS43036.1 Murein DD-endopeptidase MepM and murein hydrolase activator NlpD, contain LysM domain [Zhouia amylolytica]
MEKKKSKRKQLKKKLLHKYRLVVLNEDTFEERFSLKLNRLNVFVIGTLFAIFLIAITTVLIAFTPLREYIPGYASTALKQKATRLAYEVDSLETKLATNELYFDRIQQVLRGDIKMEKMDKDSLFDEFKKDTAQLNLLPNKQDSLLRAEVAHEDKYNVFETASSSMDFVLFPPIKGTITNTYNAKEKHFAVDIVAPEGSPVKSVADGTVIFSEWTAETGHVIIIEHGYGLISVYKHNASLTKKQGDLVKSGEVIANVGNTGELTTGPHLHFELWSEGNPVNPEEYIDFE